MADPAKPINNGSPTTIKQIPMALFQQRFANFPILVLNLANNKFSGPIPKCLDTITTMSPYAITDNFYDWDIIIYSLYVQWEIISLYVKANNQTIRKILGLSALLTSHDLFGPISQEIFRLTALQSLNLSNNHLIRKIPTSIGHINNLECLDLSSNQLSSEMPQNLSNLSFLNHMNLSNNNFIGRILMGIQLHSFDASIYIGNAELSGDPLPNNCTQEEEPNGLTQIEDKW